VPAIREVVHGTRVETSAARISPAPMAIMTAAAVNTHSIDRMVPDSRGLLILYRPRKVLVYGIRIL
jgi:hypothetical protein